ncbi:MAG: response regulator [Fibromonadaceae bacterium]|jgi:PAS domain S-box-containing protein|nr:response regulator [Fibromonadaceae bacterium]
MARSLIRKMQKSTHYVQALLVLVLLTFICTAVVSYIFVNKIEREHWRENVENMLYNAATNIEFDLLEPQSTLSNVAQFMRNMVLQDLDEEKILNILNDIDRNILNDEARKFKTQGVYGVLEAFGGNFFCNNWTQPASYSYMERPWYQMSMSIEASDKFGITKPYESMRNKEIVISYTRRIFDNDGNPLFIICIDAFLSKIIEYVTDIRPTKNSYGILLNENLEFIAHPSADMINKSSHDTRNVISKLANDLEHGIKISERESVNYKGKESIVFFKTLANGWHLGIVIPKSEYYKSLRNIIIFHSVLGVISAAILSVMLIIALKTREKTMKEIKRKSDLSHTLNRAATILLSDYEEETFENSLLKSFKLLGPVFDVDRVQVWHNEMIDSELNFVLRYEWLSEHGKKCVEVPNGLHYSYNLKPDWHSKLLKGESINTPISAMSEEDQNFLSCYEIKAIAMIPMFLHGDFWGFFSIDDCRNERSFPDEEMRVLASAGLMMSHAINRNMQSVKIREAGNNLELINHRYKSILNTIPFPITVTDSEMKWTFVNKAVENFLNVKLENIIGKPCNNWKADICETPDCGIECVKRGKKQTYFKHNNSSYKVDIEMLKDLIGETVGFVEVVQDITELEEMVKRRADAESMSRAKSVFLARISHEIRTPMNVILGITEIQLRGIELDQKLKEAFTMIYNSANLLLHIINDILDLSKIEAGKMELSPAKYEVASLISDVMQLSFVYSGSKRIEFELDIDENIPFELIGDELRIKQILNNLLSNAFKYTETGTIKLSVSVENEDSSNATLVCSISDTGYGMTEEQRSKIFEEYSRFSLASGHSIEGTGLGMSITQNLVKLMCGRISIESEIDKGSVFTVYLPQKLVGTGVLGKELVENLQKFRLASSKQEKKMQIAYEPMPYGKVLVVDDVETNIYVMQGFLAPYELSVDTARSGFEAIGKVKSGKVYDIIFMDHMMPRMDGIEAVKIIRNLGYESLIVALTANAILGQAEVFLNNGFDGFISKPVDSRQLNLFLKRYIRDRQPPEVIEEANRRESKAEPEFKFQKNSMLEIFARDAKRIVPEMNAVLENIKDASEEELRLFAINAHAMKGALANIGEMELSQKAFVLEKAGKERDRDAIKENTNEFLDVLNKIIMHIEAETEKSEVSEDEDPVYLREQLKIISEASAKYNKKAAKSAIKNLEKMSWTKDTKNIINEISEHLLHGDFEKAKNAASIA